jgi:23S rRNA pseudouridine1911/1915/1917 synthase
VAKPKNIELEEAGIEIPILYEDRSVLAVDKPGGWMLAPDWWDRTGRNLHLALQSSLSAGDFWARSRNLKFLRFIHRLDAETTGITLFAKSPGALRAYSEMFEEHRVDKHYLAVVRGIPRQSAWTCLFPLMPDPAMKGRMKVLRGGSAEVRRLAEGAEAKDAETHFEVLNTSKGMALIEARPVTGRTHQIRVHLAAAGHPVAGDSLYGPDAAAASKGRQRLALRAFKLAYRDPFQKRPVRIEAPVGEFLREWGFETKTAPKPAAQGAPAGARSA